MVHDMKENGILTGMYVMVLVSKLGLTAHSMKDPGVQIKQMVVVASYTLTEMSTRANGPVTKPTDSASTTTQMEHAMRATGKKTSSMDMARRPGLMGLAMRASIRMARRMAMASSSGLMAPLTMDSSWTITSTGRVSTPGPTNGSTPAIGSITKCTAWVLLLGLMAGGTRVSTTMIRRKVRVCSPGLMVAGIRVTGWVASNMDTASIILPRVKQRKANGKKGNA